MLKVENGEIEIRGKQLRLMAEYTNLTHQLIENKVFTEEDVDECIKLAKKSMKEVEEEAKKCIDDLLTKLLEDL